MGGNKTDENAKDHAENKWYNREATKSGKAIAALVIYGIFIFADVELWWPHSHLAGSIVGAAAINARNLFMPTPLSKWRSGWARTSDILINSQALYQLSYRPSVHNIL